MLSRVVAAAALGLALIATFAAHRPAFAQPDDNPALGTAAAPEAAPTGVSPPLAVPTEPSIAAPPAPKPKPRIKPKPQTAAASSPAQSSLFGSFSLFRLFGISEVPRGTVAFPGNYKPGTIVVDTAERRLYLVLGPGEAMRYGIGVGRIGFTWKGVRTVTDKREWPSWTPPPQMLARRPDLPRHMVGGPENPLGARALYLGDTLYRIHGTNEYETIGTAASSGCFRLTNDDVIDLYDRVRIGATVIVR